MFDLKILADEISNLKRCVNEDISVDDIIKMMQEWYSVYNVTACNIGELPLFRVRKIEDNQIHDKKQSVWCPPPKFVKQLGRVNNIGESVFYAAFDPLTAIQECRISPNEEFSLAVYHLKPLDAFNLSSVVINIPRLEVANKSINEYGIKLIEFAVEEFTKFIDSSNSYQYKVTCAIAKLLLNLPGKDSLIYPSVQNSDKINIAMKEDIAFKRVSLKSVIKCRLIAYDTEESAMLEIIELSQADLNVEDLKYEKIGCNQRITSNDWIKEIRNFGETFSSDNILKSYQKLFNEFKYGITKLC